MTSKFQEESVSSAFDRIMALASEMTGNDEFAAIWFKHQPIPGFAGETAEDLIREGKAEAVMSYLESVRAGVYA